MHKSSRSKKEPPMPSISIFYGIKIMMFFDEHNPPHFHANYAEFNAIVLINESCITRAYYHLSNLN